MHSPLPTLACGDIACIAKHSTTFRTMISSLDFLLYTRSSGARFSDLGHHITVV